MKEFDLNQKQFSKVLIRIITIPLALLALLAVVLLWQINYLLSSKKWVEHTQEVIAQAHKTQKLMVDMETGVRGFLVTGNPDFLEPYDRALPQIDAELERLGTLVSDNQSQVVRVNEIRSTFQQWEQFSRGIINLRHQDGDYQALANRGVGKRFFDHMRLVFVEFIQIEESLRTERVLATDQTVSIVVVTTVSWTMFFGTLIGIFSRRQLIGLSQRYAEAIAAEQERAEQLRQAQKLEAIGQLAGGIAHDFNNLLTAIIGYSDLSLFRLKPDDPVRKNIQEIKTAGNLAADLTRRLLAFSRKQVLQPKAVSPDEIIKNIESVLRRLIGKHIDLRVKYGPVLSTVLADSGQMEQVLMNLAVNARDAMPNGGSLTIETADVYLGQENLDLNPPAPAGYYIMLSVSDTGTGMDEQTKARIFEPFFTTKEIGRGTGLGLSTVYGIVKQSEGHIRVESKPGAGTTFKIYFPGFEEVIPSAAPLAELNQIQRGTETILLVEDDESVRSLAEQALLESGYEVLTASDPQTALNLCENHDESLHLMITDVVMPQMNGKQLAGEINRIHPETKILYMSGYADNVISNDEISDTAINFLGKPFTPQVLLDKVREVLSSPTVLD